MPATAVPTAAATNTAIPASTTPIGSHQATGSSGASRIHSP